MTEKDLLEAMNHIDEDLVQEAVEYTDSLQQNREILEAVKSSAVQEEKEAASSGGKASDAGNFVAGGKAPDAGNFVAGGKAHDAGNFVAGGKTPGNRAEGSVPEYTDGPTAVTTLTKKPPKKGSFFRIPSSAAAAITLVILAGTAMGGATIVSQQRKIRALSEQVTELQTPAGNEAGAQGNSQNGQNGTKENGQDDKNGQNGTKENGQDDKNGQNGQGNGQNGQPGEAAGFRTAGTPGTGIGTTYTLQSSYQEVYRTLKEMGAQLQEQNKGLWGIMPGGGGVDTYAAVDGAVLEAVEDVAPAAVEAGGAAGASAAADVGGHSTTNVMTEGIDESDIVKTDGSFIYMVQSGSVKITDIRQGKPGESTQLTVPFQAPSDIIEEMYVDGDTLVVISSHAEKAKGSSRFRWYSSYQDYVDQTYAYVFDISDPMKPALSGQMYQDGSYKTSRKVGEMVYLFTQRLVRLPGGSEEDALEEENLNQWVPSVNGIPLDPGCIWLPEQGYYSLVVSSFRTSDPGTIVDAKAVLNDYCEIYVGSGHIYLYRSIWSDREMTEITSIAYANGQIMAGSDTTVSGGITDSFAINEKAGILRVLTTDNNMGTVNTLYVLDPQMKLMGRIDEIARNESIYAARFLGDMAYFITYENHDPLFVADLSDPSDPKLLGQVEISGFSDYLHIWDDTHLLGIGYETDENSNRLGMKLVMFDVSDPAKPVIEDTYVTRLHLKNGNMWYESSTVSGNYKGILADPEKNLIGFAFHFIEYEANANENWYQVLSYDKKKGFEMKLQHYLPDYDSISLCRGLYSGDYFYIADRGQIETFRMTDKFKPVK